MFFASWVPLRDYPKFFFNQRFRKRGNNRTALFFASYGCFFCCFRGGGVGVLKIEDVSCQLTYQDMVLFHKVLSGWLAGLSAVEKADSDTSRAKANKMNSGGGGSAGQGVSTEARQPYGGQEGQGCTSIDDGLSESADDEGEENEPLPPPKQVLLEFRFALMLGACPWSRGGGGLACLVDFESL